jgi:CO/xanthine dehydrogenase FAD-binding subunit
VAAQRLSRAEEALIGAGVSDDGALSACGEAAAAQAEPVEDANGSVEYKRQLVRVLCGRCARAALEEAVTAA